MSERDAHPEAVTGGDDSPLYRAVIDGNCDVVRELLAGGADVNRRGPGGHAPLHLASLWSQMPVARLLLAAGADVNLPDQRGNALLCLAIERHQHELATSLLTHGADFAATRSDGVTALHLAMASGDRQLAAVLLERGADPTIRDAHGLTPFDRARDPGLLALGLDVDIDPAEIRALIDAQTTFGAELYLGCAAGEDNLCTAPVGAAVTMMMLLAGARGETHREIGAALHLPPMAEDKLHGAALILARNLRAPGVELSSASALFAAARLPIEEEFTALLHGRYLAEVHQVDFGQPVAASAIINAWAAACTRRLINRVISAEDLATELALVLANALFFKGSWAQPFKPADTKTAPFTQLDGTRAPTSLMYQRNRFNLTEIDGGQALVLPYAGDAVAMVVLLPTQVDGLPALEAMLPARLAVWLRRTSESHGLWPDEVEVYLPRFHVESSLNLTRVLPGLGMRRAFNASADFSGIANRHPLFVHRFKQTTVIDVDEDGTTAAAVTLMGGMLGAAPRRPVFRADHPYIYLIHDRRTGVVLFAGRIVTAPPPRA